MNLHLGRDFFALDESRRAFVRQHTNPNGFIPKNRSPKIYRNVHLIDAIFPQCSGDQVNALSAANNRRAESTRTSGLNVLVNGIAFTAISGCRLGS